jgi:sulfatase maturation enzyme AslB (radical SAM superfamily)
LELSIIGKNNLDIRRYKLLLGENNSNLKHRLIFGAMDYFFGKDYIPFYKKYDCYLDCLYCYSSDRCYDLPKVL